MSIILASILSSVIILPILILVLIVFFTIFLILYLTFCIGVRNFLIKNGLSTTGFWIPIYNLYLMGNILEFELNCENPLFHYAKYLFPIITIALCFVSDTLGTIITIVYTIYRIYCFYKLGEKYNNGLLLSILSIFHLQGIGLIICTKK